MARKVLIEMADDLDGSPATQTVRFGFQGVEFELDLNDENAAELTPWLESHISHARRMGGQKRGGVGAATAGSGVDAKAIRQWANEQGLQISARGRIPSQLVSGSSLLVATDRGHSRKDAPSPSDGGPRHSRGTQIADRCLVVCGVTQAMHIAFVVGGG